MVHAHVEGGPIPKADCTNFNVWRFERFQKQTPDTHAKMARQARGATEASGLSLTDRVPVAVAVRAVQVQPGTPPAPGSGVLLG